jgi:hypothetical protein
MGGMKRGESDAARPRGSLGSPMQYVFEKAGKGFLVVRNPG